MYVFFPIILSISVMNLLVIELFLRNGCRDVNEAATRDLFGPSSWVYEPVLIERVELSLAG